jgi:hypothetical protein
MTVNNVPGSSCYPKQTMSRRVGIEAGSWRNDISTFPGNKYLRSLFLFQQRLPNPRCDGRHVSLNICPITIRSPVHTPSRTGLFTSAVRQCDRFFMPRIAYGRLISMLACGLTISLRQALSQCRQTPSMAGKSTKRYLMTYGILFIAALIATVLTISAIGSRPSSDALTATRWPQIDIGKTDRIVTGSIPRH